jgi:PBP1b-binding outer membrane lipoprotein LpoB
MALFCRKRKSELLGFGSLSGGIEMRSFSAILLPFAVVLFLACSTGTKRVDPDTDDEIGGTFIDSSDVRTVADQMARSLLSTPAIFKSSTPRIVVKDVSNNSRFHIDRSLLVRKLRTELQQNAQGRITFLAREDMDAVLQEREAKRSGAVGVSTGEANEPRLGNVAGADYFLTGTISGISKTSGSDASDYINMSFRLVDAETTELIWEDGYDVKKVGESGIIYR